jgi:hypothetical protein
MDNKEQQPFVTIHCDIVEDTDAGSDINLAAAL